MDGAPPDPPTAEGALRLRFPEHAAAILDLGEGFASIETGFATNAGGFRAVEAELPRRGEEAIRMRIAGGPEVRVRELGLAGEGARAGRAVAYARAGGTSYWTAAPGGLEEWLHLDASSAGAEPAAAWEVEGATLRQVGEAVEVVDAGMVRLRVTAPAAYAVGGEAVPVRLEARGSRIELRVDAGGAEVLVDPLWASAGTMSTPRAYFTATALANGKVLVAGGAAVANTNFLASAELYDPATNTWSLAGGMLGARGNAAAVRLKNGKVLVAGGYRTSGALATAEIYDPATNLWTATGSLNQPRGNHRLALLQNGQALAVGGGDGTLNWPTTELYDPVTGTWSKLGATLAVRINPAVEALDDGRVLAAGGGAWADESTTELWDPVIKTWSYGPTMASPRREIESVKLKDGRVLIAGGFDDEISDSYLSSAEIFDPATNTLTVTGSMATPRRTQGMTLLPSGAVLVAGGMNAVGTVQSAELFDPATNAWTPAGSLATPRYDTQAVTLPNGRALVVGGVNVLTFLASAELYTASPSAASCGVGAECESGFCADGICCDAACTGACVACTAAKKGSGADGVCGPIAAGTDPDDDCAVEPASSCGTTGACDGNGACVKHPAGTVCAAASCVGSTLVKANLCDGSGTCVDGGAVDCSPFLCAGAACTSTCATDSDCAANAHCTGSTCSAKQANGTSCTLAEQCTSGTCVDSVCCDTACTGACAACSAAKKGSGSDGICGPIAADTDPDDECADQGAASCGTDGSCDGAGACRKYASGVLCLAGSCNGTSATTASLCDGKGTCVAGAQKDCAPFSCNGGVCATSCTTDVECGTGAYCDGSSCAPAQANGKACSGPGQCASGFCADGVCCDTACNAGPCDACAKAAGAPADGTCTPLTGAPCPGGTCNAGSCTATPDAGAGGGHGNVCVPGQQIECPCAGGAKGVQACEADGSGFGPCTGCPAPDGGTETSGEMGGCGCSTPGATPVEPGALAAMLGAVVTLRRRWRRRRSSAAP